MKKEQKKQIDVIALLSYLGILFIIPLLAAKNNKFAQFHARQGLVLFIAEVLTSILIMLPVIGWLGAPLLWIVWFVLIIIGIANVIKNEKKELPLIGKYADRFKI